MVKLKIETRLSYHRLEYRESNVFIAFLYCWPISLTLTLLMCNGTMSRYSHKWLNPLLSTLNHLIFSSNFWAIIIKFSAILLIDKFKLLRLFFLCMFSLTCDRIEKLKFHSLHVQIYFIQFLILVLLEGSFVSHPIWDYCFSPHFTGRTC